MKLDKFIVVNL